MEIEVTRWWYRSFFKICKQGSKNSQKICCHLWAVSKAKNWFDKHSEFDHIYLVQPPCIKSFQGETAISFHGKSDIHHYFGHQTSLNFSIDLVRFFILKWVFILYDSSTKLAISSQSTVVRVNFSQLYLWRFWGALRQILIPPSKSNASRD